MRELVKGFRAKLHGFSALVNNNSLNENHYEEINNFLFEYKNSCKSYPLSTADLQCIKKLEDLTAEKIRSSEIIQAVQIANSQSLQQLYPGEGLDLVYSTEFSRDFHSAHNTHRDFQEEKEEKNNKGHEIESSIIENVGDEKEQQIYQESLGNHIISGIVDGMKPENSNEEFINQLQGEKEEEENCNLDQKYFI